MMNGKGHGPTGPHAPRNGVVQPTPTSALNELDALRQQAKSGPQADPELEAAVGFTHFDVSSSQDNLITVLLTRDDLHLLASQTLVRVKSKEDQRAYLGVVVRGPFAEPNAVPANSTMAIGVVTHGKKLAYTFDYHGRAEIEIVGEEVDGALKPPRFRPRPQSPVFLLDDEESARVLGTGGDLCLGLVVGYEQMEARLNPRDKSILPRHTGIIGTTGGGKSTTVATLIHRAQQQGIATIVFDVEGEYTHVDKPTDQAAMLEALRRRGQKAEGVRDLHIHHLIGRASLNPRHRSKHAFSLKFSSLSPYALAEILDMSDAQQERFLKAYDVTKLLLEDFNIYPQTEQERRQVLDVDELSTGYPRMTIDHVLDVVSAYIYSLSDEGKSETRGKSRAVPRKQASLLEDPEEQEADTDATAKAPSRGLVLRTEFRNNFSRVMARVMAQSSRNEISWKALASKLHRLRRLGIFDVGNAAGVDYDSMLTPGRVSVIDLSDTDSPQLNNLVIADILRGLQEEQEARYQRANAQDAAITPVLIIIEEAHEFLSANRISQMPVLFEQVAKIAKRGRKRWMGLVFVTQLPQHLPNEVLGLINNFVIHKIADSSVISRMQKTAGSIDESLWNRVSRLAPGQALVSFSNFTRPLMVAVDPAPVKRLLVE
ncbi:ATP-binding protein [Pseudomyxococcus flavus]